MSAENAATTNSAAPPLAARLLVPWAGWLVAAILVSVGLGVEGADYPTPFAIAWAYRMLVGAELFFILVVVPLAKHSPRTQARLLSMLLLLCLGAPAVAVAAWVSDTSLEQVVASQAYLVAAAVFVAAVGALVARPSGRGPGEQAEAHAPGLAWYWLALGALGAGGPFVAFVTEDLLAARVEWLYAASPFWVADRLCRVEGFGWEWAVPFAVMIALSCAMFALSRLTARWERLY